jgi:hypothetical protein
MTTPHKHAAVIRAYADGAEIEYRRDPKHPWKPIKRPLFHEDREYRVKPEKKVGLYRVAMFRTVVWFNGDDLSKISLSVCRISPKDSRAHTEAEIEENPLFVEWVGPSFTVEVPV